MIARLWRPNQASEDALSHAVAMVATPLLLGLVGAALDAALGTRPWCMLLLGSLGAVGAFVSAYYRYEARMRAHDAGKPWTRAAERARTRTPGRVAS